MAKALSVDQFFTQLENQELPGVIAVGGAERAFVDDAVNVVRQKVLEGPMSDFNHDRKDGKSGHLQDVLNLANTLPMMAAKRLVEDQQAEDLGDVGLDALESYLKKPSPQTVLLFVFHKFDQRQKLAKLLAKYALTKRFEHPRERDMPDIVIQRAKRHALQLNEETAQAIALTVGTDIGFLERALEKLELVAEEGQVSWDMVSTHVADTHLEDAFAFGKAIAIADRKAALTHLNALMLNREAPLKLMGLVAWQLRQVVRARAYLDDGMPASEVTKELRAYGENGRVLVRAAKQFDLRVHRKRLSRLAHIDRKLKSSRASPWRWMEQMIFELCPAQNKARNARSSMRA